MHIACLDLEGVLVPEIWLNVAERTGIDALRATTRDIPDYDELMRQRLALLAQHQLKLGDIQAVISTLNPLAGAGDFLNGLRQRFQVIILSDTFYEFATPLMHQLGWPTLLCHRLLIDEQDRIVDYRLRQTDPKRKAVIALQNLHYKIIAAGDSYNDIAMLEQADSGILFCPPDKVVADYPQFPVVRDYAALLQTFLAAGQQFDKGVSGSR